MKIFLVIVVAFIGFLAWEFGSVTPCGILRSEVRTAAAKAGGLTAFVGALPDSMIDGLIAAKVGPLTQGRCMALMLQGPSSANPPQKPSPSWTVPSTQRHSTPFGRIISAEEREAERQAAAEAGEGQRECRAKKISGEFSSYLVEAGCINAKLTSAFRKANFRYMDLVYRLCNERAQLAQELDQHIISMDNAKSQMSQFAFEISGEIVARDRGDQP